MPPGPAAARHKAETGRRADPSAARETPISICDFQGIHQFGDSPHLSNGNAHISFYYDCLDCLLERQASANVFYTIRLRPPLQNRFLLREISGGHFGNKVQQEEAGDE